MFVEKLSIERNIYGAHASLIIHLAYTEFPRNFHKHSLISGFLHTVKSILLLSLNLSFYGKNIQNLRALLIRMMMDASFTLTEKLSQSVVITHSSFIFYTGANFIHCEIQFIRQCSKRRLAFCLIYSNRLLASFLIIKWHTFTVNFLSMAQ